MYHLYFVYIEDVFCCCLVFFVFVLFLPGGGGGECLLVFVVVVCLFILFPFVLSVCLVLFVNCFV